MRQSFVQVVVSARSDGDVTALDLRSRTWCLLSLSLSLSRTHTITHTNTGTKKQIRTSNPRQESSNRVVFSRVVNGSLLQLRWIVVFDCGIFENVPRQRKVAKQFGRVYSRSVNCAFFDNSTGSSIVSVSQSTHVPFSSDPTSALSGDHVRPTPVFVTTTKPVVIFTVRLSFYIHHKDFPYSQSTTGVSRMLEPNSLNAFCHGLCHNPTVHAPMISDKTPKKTGELFALGLLSSVQSRFAFHQDGDVLCCGN